MPMIVFGSTNSTNDSTNTALFLQKPYLRNNYTESNLEEDIDMEQQFKKRFAQPYQRFRCSKQKLCRSVES